MAFPTKLPEKLKKMLPAGVSLFPRPKRGVWVFALAPEWQQKHIPTTISDPQAAVEFVLAYLEERGVDTAAILKRRKEEGALLDECADKWLVLCEKIRTSRRQRWGSSAAT